MALAVFTPSIAPSPGTSNKPEVRILTSEFGDGYTQETRDGLNHVRAVLTLKWDFLTPDQGKELLRFFETHGGDKPFIYQSAVCLAPRKWTCRDWGPSIIEGGLWSFNATLRQSFSLQA